ncbi:MAG: M48 family metallopeptidase [Gallionella sp.]
MRRIFFFLLPPCLLLGTLGQSASIAAAEAKDSLASASPYSALRSYEQRIAAIGFRLTTANSRWCPQQAPQLGWILGDPRLYDPARWPAARMVYGAGSTDTPFIAALAPDGPAAAAGLSVGMGVTAINQIAFSPPTDDPFTRIDGFETAVSTLPATAVVNVTDASGTIHHLHPVTGCASDFRVDAKDKPTGSADGRLVQISAGLAGFARDDDELAAAVAHELAHNILRHRARLDAAGVDRGLFQQFGRSARLTRQTEVEADRLSVWLMQAAGYDTQAAVRFWETFGQRNGAVLFQAGTHPRWRARVVALQKEIDTINSMKARGGDLHPPLLDAPPPLD